MFMFSKALLTATYKDGKPGKPTEAHQTAEHHRFKKEFLYKNKMISKEIYASRLIQHLLIIKALETQLNTPEAKSELNAFFSLAYLEQLWRTQWMENDLSLLGVNPEAIPQENIAPATEHYLEHIKGLKPKALLAHFLLHVVGFMHGGNIIQNRYINPSNDLTTYKIPAEQYDFSPAIAEAKTRGVMSLYAEMMQEVDKINLDEKEYAEVFAECNLVYTTMTEIYDDLCRMHTQQPKVTGTSLALLSVSIVALAFIMKLAADFFNLNNSSAYRPT